MNIPENVPPHARLVIEAANSYDVEDATDAWETPAALVRWLSDHDAPDNRSSGSGRVTTQEHEAAVKLRDALRTAILDRGSPEFGKLAKPFPVQVGFEGGAPVLVPASDSVIGGVARILAAAAQSAFDGSWERIKICPADDCRVAFYDESRNRSRAWCSMQVCGNRTKTRTYRERRRREPAQRGEAPPARGPTPIPLSSPPR